METNTDIEIHLHVKDLELSERGSITKITCGPAANNNTYWLVGENRDTLRCLLQNIATKTSAIRRV